MGIVVQKYGGSSLADASAVKRVARRIVEAKKRRQRRRGRRLGHG